MDSHRNNARPADPTEHSGLPVMTVDGVLIVSPRVDLDDELLDALQQHVGARLSAAGMRGLVVDLSGILVIDSALADGLVDLACTAKVLGLSSVLAGMRPEVAIALTHMDRDFDGLQMARSVDAALDSVRSSRAH